MLLLAVETSTSRSSVALATEDGVLAAAELGRDRRHGEFVAPAIEQLLRHAGLGVGDVEAVAAGTGPGLYTGLRVGLVTAATIAATHGLPCVGVPGPDAIADRLRHAERRIAVAIDARRREVYLGTYAPGPDGAVPVRPLSVGTPHDAAGALAEDGQDVLLVGDGAAAVVAALDTLRDQGAPVPAVQLGGSRFAQPLAADVALLALDVLAAGGGAGPEVLRPVYLREADAEIGWGQRGRLQGGTAQ